MRSIHGTDVPEWHSVEAAGRVAPADPAVLAAAHDRVRPQLNAAASLVATLPSWRRRPELRLALAGLVAAAVAGAVIAAPILDGGGGAASAAAVDVLDRAALSVDVDEVTPGPGQYWEVQTSAVYSGGNQREDGQFDMLLQEQRRTTWIPRDNSQPKWWDDSTSVVDVLGSDLTIEEALELYPDTREVLKVVTEGQPQPGWQAPTWEWLQSLPRDPEQLRDRLYADSEGAGHSRDGEVVVIVADVLRSGIVPADLRVALYQVLKTVPGVEVTASEADVIGRSGVALGRLETVDGQRQEIVIDPETGDYLGDRYVDADGTVNGGTVTTTIVDEVPAEVMSRATTMICDSEYMCRMEE